MIKLSFVDVPRMLEHKRNVIKLWFWYGFIYPPFFSIHKKSKTDYLFVNFVNGHSYHIYKLIVYD